jgi:hypothetical protein
MRRFLMGLLLLFMPALVLAQTTTSTVAPPIDPSDTLGLVQALTAAFAGGDWMLGAGLLVTLLVGLFKLFGLNKLIPKKHTKWVAGVVAMLLSVAGGLMAHATWWAIITTGVGVGVIAVGGWETILEPIRNWLKKKLGEGDEKPPEPKPEPEPSAEDET